MEQLIQPVQDLIALTCVVAVVPVVAIWVGIQVLKQIGWIAYSLQDVFE